MKAEMLYTYPLDYGVYMQNDVNEALAVMRAKTAVVPEVALVLGSGLGRLADALEDAVAFSTAELPHYPASTVQGHAGRMLIGTLEGKSVLAIQGRVHYYEGHSAREITFPIRLAHALGVRRVILTNAAGGIHPLLEPGSLMLIEDHINMSMVSPLSGPPDAGTPRFPDMSAPYSKAWMEVAEQKALELGIQLRKGTYIWTTGPAYETKAEIRMFQRLGADAVGMSTVPETLMAVALGMEVLGISTITNRAAGLGEPVLDHADVLAVGARFRADLERLVRSVL